MIVEYIRYALSSEQGEELVAAYRAAQDCLARSPHSLCYDVARCAEDPGSVIVRMHGDSAEGHLSGFRRSPEFREFLPLVRPFLSAIAEMRRYELVDGPGPSTPSS